jgi:predicted transcriptional regulator
MKKYGKTEIEAQAEKMHYCREIVREIIRFGVNEEQKKQIIKLLVLELEDINLMKAITEIIQLEKENTSRQLIYTD